jgi:hypothetical protein
MPRVDERVGPRGKFHAPVTCPGSSPREKKRADRLPLDGPPMAFFFTPNSPARRRKCVGPLRRPNPAKVPPIRESSRARARSGTARGSRLGRRRCARRQPQAEAMLRQISQARAGQTLAPGMVPKLRHHGAPLLMITPQFRFQLRRRRVWIAGAGDTLNFALPKLSFLGMPQNIVEQPLLDAIEAHVANLPRQS